MTKYLLAGGGTAGHVNPLLALADFISAQEPGSDIWALGTVEGLEARLVPERGYELLTIARLPFPRKPSGYALKFPFKFIKAVARVKRIIREQQIDVVVGFGGYASTPAYIAAKQLGVPIVVHEANALPGMANKLGAKYTDYVAVTFANTPLPHAQVLGMPLRKEIEDLDLAALRPEAQRFFGLESDKPTLLVTGGSLGARAINEGITSAVDTLLAAGVQILHVWGRTDITAPKKPGHHVIPYCDRMDLAFAAADLVISRAGSTTVSELTGLGLPAVYVPFRVGNGEQALNCKPVVDAGGALMVEDADITAQFVSEVLLPLLNNSEKLSEMSSIAIRHGELRGTENLYKMVLEALDAKDNNGLSARG